MTRTRPRTPRHDLHARIRRSARATGSVTSPPTRWPTSCRRSRTSTRRSTDASRSEARTRRSGSATTRTCCSGSSATAPEDVQAFLVGVPPDRRRDGSPTSRGRSWAWSSRPSSRADHQPAFVEGRAAEDVPVRLPVRAHAGVVPAAARGARRVARRARRRRPGVPRGPGQHDERVRARRLGMDPRLRGGRADIASSTASVGCATRRPACTRRKRSRSSRGSARASPTRSRISPDVDTREHLDAIRVESGRFAKAARGPLDTRVPSCPEWSLGDLVWHLGGVQRFWTEVVRTQATDPRDDRAAGRCPRRRAPRVVRGRQRGLQQHARVHRSRRAGVELGRRRTGRSVGAAPAGARGRRPPLGCAERGRQREADRSGAGGRRHRGVLHVDARPRGRATLRGNGRHPARADRRRPTRGSWTCATDGRISPRRDRRRYHGACVGSDLLLLLWRRLGPGDVDIEGERSSLERFLAIGDLN